ncbi:MAG: hypothetical protein GF375_06845 [Candidatus Omnitrophica bacterium]|nr:hypothetical protein [Candidatus Omnitrophota bacterium]MBD3269693.1 hypothetical protein [Candidatus Omnitrophota bacterium]
MPAFMKVSVEDLKRKEMTVSEDIPAADWDMDSFDVKFLNDLHIVCKFFLAYKEVVADAQVTVNRKIICSRCLGEVCQIVKQNFIKSYEIDKLDKFLDIDKDIREEILLNFPLKVLCSSKCKGLCPGCGANLNIEACKCRDK